MRDEDYMKSDFEKQMSPSEKIEYAKIKAKVSRGLRIFEIFLWIFIGIGLGMMIATNLTNSSLDPVSQHHNVIDVEDGQLFSIKNNELVNYTYYSIILETNRSLFSSRSEGKSMYPALWGDSHQVYTYPQNTSEINVGDIIIYNADGRRILHRVIKVKEDDEGWYARAKGDNNLVMDPYRIRFDDIDGLLIAITY